MTCANFARGGGGGTGAPALCRSALLSRVGKKPIVMNGQAISMSLGHSLFRKHQKNMTDNMGTRSPEDIEQSTEKLLQDLKAVVQDGEELLRAGAHDLSERGMAARERLAHALEVAQDTRRKLEERAVAGVRATDRMVHEYPYQSVGVAFGLGMLLGILLNKR
jgi:ElaB/YqjD/DUF883 family membrane-anchored ribosome-binding protein